MMRDLAISYGNSRQAKNWVNKTISFDALKERLKTTIRTTESAEEYAKMSKAQRDAAKDHGGFVGGTLKGGRRKIDTVELRSMIALDGDRIDKAFLDNYETIAPYTSVLYTTHSSTEDSPRVRIIFPMTRDVSSEEFVAVSRYVAQALGIDFFDECSYQPNQLMYWPSTPQNGVFVYKETDKEWLDPDAILSAHPEWTDPTRLPTSSRESKANTVTQQKVQDPLSKDGVVGLFNRVFFPVTKALEAFLSDIYEPTDNLNRWHLIESRSIAGVEIKDDKFVYSHHAKDPAYLKLCNWKVSASESSAWTERNRSRRYSMRYEPHEYQTFATEFILSHPIAAVLLEMGLGKSVITLTALFDLCLDSFLIRKVLVIAPLRVARDTWPSEIRKWDHLAGLTYSVAVGTEAERKAALLQKASLYIINRENVDWLVNKSGLPFDYDMIVIDELSSFKSWQAKRFKSLLKVRPQVKRIVGLTGTPSSNGLMDLWAQFRLLDLGKRLGRYITHYRNAYGSA